MVYKAQNSIQMLYIDLQCFEMGYKALNHLPNLQIVSHRLEQFYKAMNILTRVKSYKQYENTSCSFYKSSSNLLVAGLDCKDIYLIFSFYFMSAPVKQYAPRSTHVVCRAHTQRKFVDKNGLFNLGGLHAQVSQYYP